MLLSLAAFVIVIGPLIFVHEAGHFLAAKMLGVQVLRFSLGFGRPLFQWRGGETEYWISIVPLGGYVKMAGLEDEGLAGELEGGKASVPVDPARAFDRKPLWARMIIILAGVTMNFIVAVLVYSGLALGGVLQPQQVIATTQVDSVRVSELPASAAPLAVLHRGDRILDVNGHAVHTWNDLQKALLLEESPVHLRVEGRPEPIVLDFGPRMAPRDTADRLALRRTLSPYLPPVVTMVVPGSPAARGGLEPGDRLIRVGSDTIMSWGEFARVSRASPGKPLTLTVARGDTLKTVTVTPETLTDQDPVTKKEITYGLVGVSAVRPSIEASGVFGALRVGFEETGQQIDLILSFLKRLVIGRASARELGGPITIAQMSGQAARGGITVLFGFMALMSINLAVLNLLPIPVLDGGQMVFLVAEGIGRKPLSVQLRLRLTQAGLVFIVGLMLFVIGNELLRVLQRAFS
jgi:regulator of sigma E protease